MPTLFSPELEVRPGDWPGIIGAGALFGLLGGYAAGELSGSPLLPSLLSGSAAGLAIALYARGAVPLNNRHLLPRLPRRAWLPVSLLLAFLCGWAGAATALALLAPAPLLAHRETLALIAGFGAAGAGAGFHRLVVRRNLEERLKLAALEQQLNPHFLFNAFNSLAELVHHDPDRTEKALLDLSALFSAMLEKRSLIPLKEELAILERYVALENIRFADKVALAVEVPQEAYRFQLPKLALQLLVENAIKHGMVPGRPLTVSVIGTVEGNRLRLTVTDDGKGFERLKPGTGLSNLAERLALLSGGALEGKSEFHGATFTVTVEAQAEKEEKLL